MEEHSCSPAKWTATLVHLTVINFESIKALTPGAFPYHLSISLSFSPSFSTSSPRRIPFGAGKYPRGPRRGGPDGMRCPPRISGAANLVAQERPDPESCREQADSHCRRWQSGHPGSPPIGRRTLPVCGQECGWHPGVGHRFS